MPKSQNKGTFSQLVDYGIIMAFIDLFDIGFFILLVAVFNVFYIYAAIISFTVGIFINYILNVRYAFDQSRFKNKNLELFLYFLSSMLSLALNIGLLYALTSFFHIYYIYSRILAGIFAFFSIFFIRKIFLFSKKESSRSARKSSVRSVRK